MKKVMRKGVYVRYIGNNEATKRILGTYVYPVEQKCGRNIAIYCKYGKCGFPADEFEIYHHSK